MRTAILSALAFFVFLSLAAPGLNATTYVVTKTEDTNDGVCDGDCSLREAIAAANSDTDPDTILLSRGTYVLSMGGLSVTEDLSVIGAGSSGTILDASGFVGFETLDCDLRVVDLSIQDGLSAVRSVGGSVCLESCTISGHTASGIRSEGQLVIEGCLLHSNTTATPSFNGGAIHHAGVEELTIVDTSIINNTAASFGSGAGVFVPCCSGGPSVKLIRCEVRDNCAGKSGGGISQSAGSLDIVDCQFVNNTGDEGGGIHFLDSSTSLTIVDTVVEGNTGRECGGGLYISPYSFELQLSMLRSAVVDNSGPRGAGLFILLEFTSGDLVGEIQNSTLSGNCASPQTSVIVLLV